MTKEQMEYVMMLDGVMPEKDVLVSLKDLQVLQLIILEFDLL